MSLQQQRKPDNSRTQLVRYAGMGMQLLVSMGIALYAGYKADDWLGFSIPLFVWLLPLIVLCAMIYKLIRDTSKKNVNR